MMNLLSRNALVISLTLAILGAFLVPGIGQGLGAAKLTVPLVMAIFLCQGMGVRGEDLRDVGNHAMLVVWGAVIAHVMAPALALGTARLLGWDDANRIGFVMMACMAPTLVSGVVIAGQAKGEHTVAIVLTISLNLLSILTIPWNLKWTLGATAPIDQTALLVKLVTMILVPALVGHWIGHRWPGFAARRRSAIKYVPVVFLGVIVFMSIAKQVERVRTVRLVDGLWLLLGSLAVHYSLLLIGYAGARWIWRREEGACRSLAIVCSQKTIPVAVVVWQIAFADDYPLAIIPPVIYHLSQIYADGLLARWWSGRSEAV